ncbi:uroporphyrinogen-III C-methyltransferase [Bradyrhizobium sp. CCBAU 53338]|uniref:uroporphyrinogen-III C-methyltransferase n=1 Tax=Bradyrhizobium sp. CCBAU 53338 TaxID=1325111 RepID=UPI001FF074A3|nr:uroporphyrinogen-III C-methyltransferase [Bradyrhizobium sp. CCBAU 53338]
MVAASSHSVKATKAERLMAVGKVYLVGAGPGDPELLTLKAVRAIGEADVVVYDRLVPPAILDTIADGVLRISVGKQPAHHPVPQDEINGILVRLARAGRTVVRLKGGDPFIFGRGSEEAAELEAAGIPYEVVPGITAAQGCAAAVRVPLTHRGLASGVRFVTGHRKANEPLDLDWRSLADPETTLVVYMGLANLEEIVRKLVAEGLPANTPALAICQGTTPQERRVCTHLETLPMALKEASFNGPVLFIIGRVAAIAMKRSERSDARTTEAISVVA